MVVEKNWVMAYVQEKLLIEKNLDKHSSLNNESIKFNVGRGNTGYNGFMLLTTEQRHSPTSSGLLSQ